MKYLTTTAVLFVIAALVTPIDADAQIGRKIRDRIKNRAEERAKSKAEQKTNEIIDRNVDKAVDALFAKTEEKVNKMIESAFSKNKTTVDLENNVISQEGQPDVTIEPNASGPADAAYVQYLHVTVFQFPGTLGELLGNGAYDRVYLQEDRQLNRSAADADLLDVGNKRVVNMNFEEGNFWIMNFSEFGDAVASSTAMMQAPGGGDMNNQQGPTDSTDVEFEFEVRDGGSGTVRGVEANRKFVIMKAKVEAEDEDTGETTKGNLYTVVDTWLSSRIAGAKTIATFNQRAGEAMGEAFRSSQGGETLQAGVLGDPRIGPALEEASKKLSEVDGFTVQAETFVVMTPEDVELDLEKVLAEGETDMEAWAASMDEESEGVQEQVTLFSLLNFVSNMNTEEFSEEVFEIPDNLEEIPSPLKRYQDYLDAQGDNDEDDG